MSAGNHSTTKLQGCVFNIQRYSLHDGPGIRTIVFLKGCPLSCRWCSNPESQCFQPEIAYNTNKCIGVDQCGRCTEVCPHKAILTAPDGKIYIDRQWCRQCMGCAQVCPAKALHTFGALMSIDEVLKVVEADEAFYCRSGGGLTLSGGEPLAQAEFTQALLREAKRRRINTAMETCGLASWSDLAMICPDLDSILYDIKTIDSDKHRKFTGCDNTAILENFARLCEFYPTLPKLVRTPLIPEFNDSVADIMAIVDFIKGYPNVTYEVLPYHRMGQPKYEYLGREYSLSDSPPSEEKVKEIKDLAAKQFV